MNLLAVLVLAASSASLQAVDLTAVDSQLAVRVTLAGRPGMVAVHREGDTARVSITETRLGTRFAGGSRFAWTPTANFDVSTLAGPTGLDRLEVVATDSEVSVLLHVPPEIAIDVRRDRRGLLLVFREASADAPPPTVARATPPPPAALPTPPPPEPTPARPDPEPAAPVISPPVTAAPPVPTAEAPTVEPPGAAVAEPLPPPPAPAVADTTPDAPTDTAQLAAGLFPAAVTASASSQEPPSGGSVDELYASLFPDGAPQTAAEVAEPPTAVMGAEMGGVPFGPFRLQGGVDVRYIDADTFVEASGEPVRDRYLEVVPRLAATAPLGDGRFTVEYMPYLRAFATFDQVNRNSHRLSAELELPVGPAVVLKARDAFVSGTLDTREVDPGGEYFFGLGEFRRNTIDGGASIMVGQRTSLELNAGTSVVRFQEPSTFFDYDTRFATAGIGYELTPNLKATVDYMYDAIPTPDQRPEAESTAHNARVTFSGDILPLLSGQLMLGYRDQETPNAGENGTRYTGFIMGGALTKQFTRRSDITVYVNRSTPASAFENNSFYVFTAVQGSTRFPLFWELQAQGGLGYQWNDYRVASAELGVPREDRILAWYAGLRRPVFEHLFLSATYRRQERRSNLDAFDVDADGFLLQLEWDIFGYTP